MEAKLALDRAKEKQIEVIETKIMEACDDGRSSLSIKSLFKETIEHLKKEGYEVKVKNNNVTISWEKAV